MGSLIGFWKPRLHKSATILNLHTMEMMRAVLDSNFWLATHVVAITIGYSTTFLAGFLGIAFVCVHLFGSISGKKTRKLDRTLGSMIYGITCFSLFFSLVGTVLGGIWADQSWGRFWGWDAKENGALRSSSGTPSSACPLVRNRYSKRDRHLREWSSFRAWFDQHGYVAFTLRVHGQGLQPIDVVHRFPVVLHCSGLPARVGYPVLRQEQAVPTVPNQSLVLPLGPRSAVEILVQGFHDLIGTGDRMRRGRNSFVRKASD